MIQEPETRPVPQSQRNKRGRPLRSGDRVKVTVLKADGTCYRRWTAMVEHRDADAITVISRVGDPVGGSGGGWTQRHTSRTIYWFDRPYNLVEFYETDGRFKQIYVHVASRPVLTDRGLVYTDHELDVVLRPGQSVRVLDEDEFEVAAQVYGYTEEFQLSCRRAVDEVLHLVEQWKPLGAPRKRR